MNQQAGTTQALLLLDYQHDFLASDGRLPIAQNQVRSLIEHTREAIAVAQQQGYLLIMIGNEFRKNQFLSNLFRQRSAMKGSPGAIWDERVLVPHARYIPKWKNNAFSNPELSKVLHEQKITTIALAGVFANQCVRATANAATRQGFTVQILASAVGCASDRSKERALRRLSKRGVTLIEHLL
jgi:nicotinamidase-related amidase